MSWRNILKTYQDPFCSRDNMIRQNKRFHKLEKILSLWDKRL